MGIENRYIESRRQFSKEMLSHFTPSDSKETKIHKGKEYTVVGTIEEKYHLLKRIIIGIATLCRMIFSRGGEQNLETWKCIKKGYRPINLLADSPQLSLALISTAMRTQGLINLAPRHSKGQGEIEKDIDKVFPYLDQAIKEKPETAAFLKAKILVKEKRDAQSYLDLGRMYRDGKVLRENGRVHPEDFTLALVCLRKAANLGSIDAQIEFGIMCVNNNDFARATEYLGKAADSGNLNAQLILGSIYKDGMPIEKNKANQKENFQNLFLASKYFKMAADQGNVDAIFELGLICTDRDFEKAVDYFDEADKQGHKTAKFYKAKMLAFRKKSC